MATTIFKREKASLGVFEFDALLESSTEKRATVTYLPLQEGARAADHRILEPIKVRMTGAMSNNPMKDLSETFSRDNLANLASGAAISAAAGLINNPYITAGLGVGLGYLAGRNKESHALNAWDKLTELWSSSEPFSVVTGLGETVNNMVIERLYQETDPDNENALIFVAELIEFQYIKLGTGQAKSEKPQAASELGSGDQAPPTEDSQIQNTEGASTLASPAVTNQQVNAQAPAQAVG